MSAEKIKLVTYTYTIDPIGQRVPTTVETEIYGNKDSVSGQEVSEAGLRGIKADCRVIVWSFDYNGAEVVKIGTEYYSVYRVYVSKGKTELYLEKRVGNQ